MSTDDRQDREFQELKGHVEQTVGQVFGDDRLVAHGKADQIAAHAKLAAARAGETARQLGERFRGRAMRKLGELHERLHEEAEKAARERQQDQERDREQ